MIYSVEDKMRPDQYKKFEDEALAKLLVVAHQIIFDPLKEFKLIQK